LLPHAIPAPGALLATRVTPAMLTDPIRSHSRVADLHLQILETFSKSGVSKIFNFLFLLENSESRATITNDVLYQMSYTGAETLLWTY
jgi:hypothetical protein